MKTLIASALGLALSLSTASVFAQNVDPFFHGDEAALASGAVVASVRDSGAFWYNPAGFGGLKRGLVSASASTFGVRVRRVPEALRFTFGRTTDTDDLDSFDVISVPNAVVAATKLTDSIAIAGGLLTTNRDLRSAVIVPPQRLRQNLAGGELAIRQRLDLQQDIAWYNFGVALAAEISPRLRVGAAVYGGYAKYSLTSTYVLDAESPGLAPPFGGNLFGISSQRVTNSGFTLMGSAGVQYEVSPNVTMGATIRSPELVLATKAEGGALNSSSSNISTGLTSLEETRSRFGSTAGLMVNPARLLLGSAFALGRPQSFLELGVDVAHGLPASELFPAKKPVMNARIGVRYMLSPAWIVGGGLFTDRSFTRQDGGTDRIDWYGLTAGVSKRTPLALTKNPAPDAIVLVTTLSLRLGAGVGEAGGTELNLNAADAGSRAFITDVVFWEVMPYLGSAVIF